MAGPSLDPAVHADIHRLRATGMHRRAIAAELGIGETSVGKYLKIPVNGVPAAGKACPVPIDPVRREQDRAAARAREDEIRDAVREQAFREFLEGVVKGNVPPMPSRPAPVASKAKKAHNRFLLLTLGDWHFEEVVKEAGVMGLNKYDIPSACRRVYRVVHALIDWKRNFLAGGKFAVGELTVVLLGDFLTGTLHGLERHSDAPNVVRAALACGDLLALALRDMAAEFPRLKVIGVVGNHGRLPDDKKVPTKDPTRSWDFLAYEVARRRLDTQKNIEWHLPESYGALFDVGTNLCYAAHGNFIPNNLGVVGYGIRRFTASLASNLSAAGKPLRYAFFGHWHAANSAEFAGVEAFINPSLIGTQEYGFLSGGSVNRSAQELHLFDADLGYVGKERIYGDGPGYDGTYEIKV